MILVLDIHRFWAGVNANTSMYDFVVVVVVFGLYVLVSALVISGAVVCVRVIFGVVAGLYLLNF